MSYLVIQEETQMSDLTGTVMARDHDWHDRAVGVHVALDDEGPYAALLDKMRNVPLDEMQQRKLFLVLAELDRWLDERLRNRDIETVEQLMLREDYAVRALIENLEYWLNQTGAAKNIACAMLIHAELRMTAQCDVHGTQGDG